MPDITTHYLFGEFVLNRLNSKSKQLIETQKSAFIYGVQGPDILFFRKAFPKRNPVHYYGSLLHREKTDQIFLFFQQYINSKKGTTEYPILTAYYMGFLCHYFLDSIVHPYVYCLTERRLGRSGYSDNPHTVHAQIEAELDSIFYPLFCKQPVSSFPVRKIFTIDSGSKTVIAKCYTQLLSDVFQINSSISEIIHCFDDFVSLSSLLFKHQHLVRTIGFTAGKIYSKADAVSAHIKPQSVSSDTANFCENPWYYPQNPSQKSTQSVLGLFHEAADAAQAQLNQINPILEQPNALSFEVKRNFAGNDLIS